jgi:hypothetical protein
VVKISATDFSASRRFILELLPTILIYDSIPNKPYLLQTIANESNGFKTEKKFIKIKSPLFKMFCNRDGPARRQSGVENLFVSIFYRNKKAGNDRLPLGRNSPTAFCGLPKIKLLV